MRTLDFHDIEAAALRLKIVDNLATFCREWVNEEGSVVKFVSAELLFDRRHARFIHMKPWGAYR